MLNTQTPLVSFFVTSFPCHNPFKPLYASSMFVLNYASVTNIVLYTVLVGPCHHGMERPEVADRGTASDKEVSCE
jgi:hypothetical protein